MMRPTRDIPVPPRIGLLESGPRGSICDVDGVTVGHFTCDAGEIQTGITVVRPHPEDPFLWKVPAAVSVLNGFGKSVGLMQVQELGVLESPIALTNTFSVGTVSRALIERACQEHSELGRGLGTYNPLVFECNDGFLNDLHAPGLTLEHLASALDAASGEVEQGSVGAGRGMSMFGLKGGIGSASRQAEVNGQRMTVGCLVLANFGKTRNLVVGGRPAGMAVENKLQQRAACRESGSIIMVLATNAPLSDRQLRRLSLRTGAGLARTGSFFGHGSGDIALAFSTAYRIPHHATDGMPQVQFLHETHLDPLFEATAESTEQAIVNALFHATAVRGFRDRTRESFIEVLPEWRKNI